MHCPADVQYPVAPLAKPPQVPESSVRQLLVQYPPPGQLVLHAAAPNTTGW